MKLFVAAAATAAATAAAGNAGAHLGADASAACAARGTASMALVQEKALNFGVDCEGMCKRLGAYPKCECPGFNGEPASDDDTRGCYDKYCQDPSAPCPNDAFVTCVSENTKAALLQWNSVISHVDTRLNMMKQVLRAGRSHAATSCGKTDVGAKALVQLKASNMGVGCEDMCKKIGAYPDCACPGFAGQPASEGDTRACYDKYCQDPSTPCPNDHFGSCVDESTKVSALQWKAVMSHATFMFDSMLQAARLHNSTKAAQIAKKP